MSWMLLLPKGATYEEIKAYVWDKHHLKVSSLYISQIKRKCGLEIGQNYNLSKSEILKCQSVRQKRKRRLWAH